LEERITPIGRKSAEHETSLALKIKIKWQLFCCLAWLLKSVTVSEVSIAEQ
jgi:hypothetical protein